MKYNFDKVFGVFVRHYNNVPLEVFKKNPYKTLVSTILSSRTRDETTLASSNRLFKIAPNIKSLGKLKEKEIRNLIFPVGFYKTKARHLTKLAAVINKDFEGQIPSTKTALVGLPGVGVKTANLTLNRAFDLPAIAVDTHVHKISNLLGWVKTKTPEQTERELVKIVPTKHWTDMNRLFVSIGRQFNTKKRLEEFLKGEGLL